jgi:hypothetical protein
MFDASVVVGPGIALATIGTLAVVFFTTIRPMLKGARSMLAEAQGVVQAQAAASNLRATGLPSQARVLSIEPTGMTINDAHQCRLALEVGSVPHAPDAYRTQPYRVSIVQALHPVVLPRVQPGMMLPVRIDAANPANVVLDV